MPRPAHRTAPSPAACLPYCLDRHARCCRYAFGSDINETKIVQIAEKIVAHGLRDAGYVYVNLDGGSGNSCSFSTICCVFHGRAVCSFPLVSRPLLRSQMRGWIRCATASATCRAI